jgi:hypothetical protein
MVKAQLAGNSLLASSRFVSPLHATQQYTHARMRQEMPPERSAPRIQLASDTLNVPRICIHELFYAAHA